MNNLYNIWLAMAFGSNCSNGYDIANSKISPAQMYEKKKSLHEYDFLTNKQLEKAMAVDAVQLNKIYEEHEKLGIKSINYTDKEYPEYFLNIQKAPLVLFYKGDISLLNYEYRVGIIGTRNPDRDGIKLCTDLSKSLAKNNALIVSGLAQGLDSVGHLTALKEGTKTIAYVGIPLDKYYPASNKQLQEEIAEKGLVVSEYYVSQMQRSSSFLERNRLIAATSQAVCIVQAKEKSGTLATARLALEYGCDLFCVPGSVYNPLHSGTNKLLVDGSAKAAVSGSDILKHIQGYEENLYSDKFVAPKLSEEQTIIYNLFNGQTLSITQIFQNTNIPMAKLKAILTEMELLDIIKQQGPAVYYKM